MKHEKIERYQRSLAYLVGLFVLVILGLSLTSPPSPDWGFFGHRKINRMAVFTLPPDLIQFYKKNIEYITEHSVDPDKRRYATKHEAVRHYIDIDSWGENPFYDVPRIFEDALTKYSKWSLVNETDTIPIDVTYTRDTVTVSRDGKIYPIQTDTFRRYFQAKVMPQYYEDQWIIKSATTDSLIANFSEGMDMMIVDEFSKEGILPYHLISMYYWLVKAFEERDLERILRLSAEYGHYIGDAHVPLHTTKNYNGQFTDQLGIHAFWESRLPELFADSEYSFLVGKASYIGKPNPYFWNVVKESHELLDEVLQIEKELTKTYPEDQQLCYDDRLDRTIRTQCPEFARAYHDGLDGMVENRMQDAIYTIGSVWYSAWVDAGQPDLLSQGTIEIDLEEIKIDPDIKTREHGG